MLLFRVCFILYFLKFSNISGFWKFIEITLRHGCSPVNLMHFFGTLFYKNTSGGLLVENISNFSGNEKGFNQLIRKSPARLTVNFSLFCSSENNCFEYLISPR